MQAVDLKPQDLGKILRDFRSDGNLVGVAIGAKEISGTLLPERHAVTFFVTRKIPMGPAGKLANGAAALPRQLPAGPTDVVELAPTGQGTTGDRTGKPTFVPGGKLVSNGKEGTMACLVRDRQTGEVLALTNHHVAALGQTAGFFHLVTEIARGNVTRSQLHEKRTRFFAGTGSGRVRIDASAVSIDSDDLQSFSNTVPHFGPVAFIAPTPATAADYERDMIGRRVFSYSRLTKQRFGTISHVHYTFDDGPRQSQFCFLVRGDGASVPGVPGDSGKLWMTKGAAGNAAIGLHLGLLNQGSTGTPFAAATDLHALSNYWNFDLLQIPAS